MIRVPLEWTFSTSRIIPSSLLNCLHQLEIHHYNIITKNEGSFHTYLCSVKGTSFFRMINQETWWVACLSIHDVHQSDVLLPVIPSTLKLWIGVTPKKDGGGSWNPPPPSWISALLPSPLLLIASRILALIVASIPGSTSTSLALRGRRTRLSSLVVPISSLVGCRWTLAPLSRVATIPSLLWVTILTGGWGHVVLLLWVGLPLTMCHLRVPSWRPIGGILLLVVVGHLVVHRLTCGENTFKQHLKSLQVPSSIDGIKKYTFPQAHNALHRNLG